MANEKATKAEMIAALVTDRFSGFKDGDQAILEACSDVRLEEFRAASDAAKTAAQAVVKLETENRNNAAGLKVAQDRLKAAEAPMTAEEFSAKAPPEIKAILDEIRASEAAERAAYITKLKDLGADSEEVLKNKTMDELKTLAKYARIEVDYSGRGLPRERRDAGHNSYAPPSPYKAGLEALRAKTAN
jgi:predicted component of type VI protein secretion system